MSHHFHALLSGLLGLLAIGLAWPLTAADTFPLKEGDTWVMAGDSITAQRLHSNYFEAFCFARYPQLTFRFRNSGVGGDTIPKVLARFDWDVAAWKPTVVSVELGMNDQGGFSVEQFVTNMAQLNDRIRAAGARPVLLSPSPINDGGTTDNIGRNAKLDAYTKALAPFAIDQKQPFSNQFHALLDVWGKNKPNEAQANLLALLKTTPIDDSLAGAEHLRAFLDAQEKKPSQLVSMQGDPVHPGPCGQLTMAAALLKGLGAESFVSSATISADGKVAEQKGCEITNVKIAGRGVAFDRQEDVLPFPIPDEARPVLPLYPAILDLSQYTLKVTGLPPLVFVLKVNGQETAILSHEHLAAGVNLTAFDKGPIATQGKAILAAVAAKEGLVSQWRAVSRSTTLPDAPANAKAQLAPLATQVESADAKIREAAKPQKLHFEIVAVEVK